MGKVRQLWEDKLTDINFRFLNKDITLNQAKRELGDLGMLQEEIEDHLDLLCEADHEGGE